MWVNKEPKKQKIKLFEVGPAVLHSVICWLCDKEPAVYSMHPNWVFKPCWQCQRLLKPLSKKKWYQFWK